MAGPPTTYTREEMDAILKRAIEQQQAKTEGVTREELIAAAGEVGIPREEIEAAARELDAQKAARAEGDRKQREESLVVDEARARLVRDFWRRAVTYGVLTGFFFAINWQTHANWWIWAALGMGMSLSIRASRVFFGDPRDLSRRERRRMRREEAKREVKDPIEEGVDALVRAAYEQRTAKGRASNARPRVADPNVRVDARESDERADDADAEDAARRNRR